jgi:hypothetical protein
MAWSPGGAGHVLLILIDTNVPSAMMRVAAEPTVEQWFDSQPPESAWTTQPGRVFWGHSVLGMGPRVVAWWRWGFASPP